MIRQLPCCDVVKTSSSIQPDKGSSEAWWYKPAVIHKDFRQGPETFADPKDGAPWCRCNPPA
ncbi:unnamed protein product [Fusarium graminearum]|uniref:Uncharacterized protein n=1 Tax=Gibberella zeae TaxID=5518 RepID=A0A4E9DZ38_GIBZA|nr:unnamed protein product [Fusarium graminearum]CAF3598668.1 unnamed protein product [Fusarium graminearum]CAG1983949.1 unnamed protein product [Fusarium graminearum]CAG2005618.1 unnamed protein product [Fusarium graminearum]